MTDVNSTYFSSDAIRLAYYRVLCGNDRMAKDKVGLKAFGNKLDENCLMLSIKVQEGKYKPENGFKYYEPKASKTQRTKTLLMVEDALVYQAIANKIAENTFDKLKENDDFVFGSLLSPEVAKGVSLLTEEQPKYFFFQFWKSLYKRFSESVIRSIQEDKARFKFETDITGFFDSIPHYNFLQTLSEEFLVEDEILDLLSECLNTWSGTKDRKTPGVGIPQGPQPSYFFANLLLYPLDAMIVSNAHKYYRYMDDIKIYGYNQDELLDVLVTIDNYAKGHGLSINSKKTSIDEIDPNREDETVRELRKIADLNYDDILDEQSPNKENLTEAREVKNLNVLSEQDGQQMHEYINSKFKSLTDPDEIKAFWFKTKAEVEVELASWFEIENDDPILKVKEIQDTDFIRAGVQYSKAIGSLRNMGEKVHANESLIPFWMFAMKNYFWRANNYSYSLGLYRSNENLKSQLISYFKTGFHNYEWVRYHLLIILSTTQDFTDQELRKVFFKALKTENSKLVRIALYRLLFSKSNNPQFISSVRKELSQEKDNYIKWVVADFLKYRSDKIPDFFEFLETISI